MDDDNDVEEDIRQKVKKRKVSKTEKFTAEIPTETFENVGGRGSFYNIDKKI